MGSTQDTLQQVDYDFVEQWRSKIGYAYLDLVNLDPGPHGRSVWTHVSAALMERQPDQPPIVEQYRHLEGNIWIGSAGSLEVKLPPGPAPRFYINRKHKILLVNWNVYPEDREQSMTRLKFVQAIEQALVSLED
jgi:hypothetical protein